MLQIRCVGWLGAAAPEVKSGSTHPWCFYTDSGVKQRTVQLHPLNKRNLQSNIQSFALGISKEGMVQGVAGEPWLLWSRSPAAPLAASASVSAL